MAPGSLKMLLLVVSDIQTAWQDLTGKGVEVSRPEQQPWGAVHAEFADPDGNRWTLQQLRRAAAP